MRPHPADDPEQIRERARHGIRYCQDRIARNPDHPIAHFHLSGYLSALGETEEADAVWERAMQLLQQWEERHEAQQEARREAIQALSLSDLATQLKAEYRAFETIPFPLSNPTGRRIEASPAARTLGHLYGELDQYASVVAASLRSLWRGGSLNVYGLHYDTVLCNLLSDIRRESEGTTAVAARTYQVYLRELFDLVALAIPAVEKLTGNLPPLHAFT